MDTNSYLWWTVVPGEARPLKIAPGDWREKVKGHDSSENFILGLGIPK